MREISRRGRRGAEVAGFSVFTASLRPQRESKSNIVGGTIVIPHTRRAAEYRDELEKQYFTQRVLGSRGRRFLCFRCFTAPSA